MFQALSWQNFLVGLAVFSAAWYAVVGLLYYSSDFRRWTQSMSEKVFGYYKPTDLSKKLPVEAEPDHEDQRDLFKSALCLRDEISAVLNQSLQRRFVKEEMMMALQKKIQNYPALRQTAFRVEMNKFIDEETKNRCSIRLSEDELKMLWYS